jgi:predicted peptidase
VKAHGVPKLVEQYPDLHFPFIVVSPQCSLDATWSSRVLGRVLDEVVREYHVDRDRIYVTGLSMGGLGTWALAIAHPRRFAAIAPICGGGDPSHICVIKHLPVWTFHGAKDTGVPIEYTEVMVQALHECGGNVRFTIYPDAEHDSWTETYNNPELYRWFLEHRRT